MNGSMKRGKSKGFAETTGDLRNAKVATAAGGGSTKATGATSERSVSWQQDIAQAIIPDMPCSCPQSI